MAQNKETRAPEGTTRGLTPGKGGRPPRADTAATDVLRVRLTAEERRRLSDAAAAQGRPVADHVRAWINGEAREATQVTEAVPVDPSARPTDFVTARPRRGVEPKLWSRWTPRYVWTLHVAPGRLNGPPLCVRRRVLGDTEEDGCRIETPGGGMGANFDTLQQHGHARAHGSHRAEDDPPTIAGRFWGCDLALEVYDHNPTAEERGAWLRRHRLEQALIRSPPSSVWVTFPAARVGAPDRAVECSAERTLGKKAGAVSRSDLEVHLPGYRPPRPGGFYEHMTTVDMYELAVVGSASARGADGARRVYLHRPTAEQLRADGRARAEEQAEAAHWKAEAKNFADAWFRPATGAPIEDPGAAAVRALGLDPATATEDDVQAAFRARAQTGHADKGGKLDMGELVRQRDAARAYVNACSR